MMMARKPTWRCIRSQLAQKYHAASGGRNGMHKYNNQDHAMMTSMLTVKNILANAPLYDVWNVNEDAEYHEAGLRGAGARQSVRLVPRRIGSG